MKNTTISQQRRSIPPTPALTVRFVPQSGDDQEGQCKSIPVTDDDYARWEKLNDLTKVMEYHDLGGGVIRDMKTGRLYSVKG